MNSLDSLLIKPTTLFMVKSGSVIEIYRSAVEISFGRKFEGHSRVEKELDKNTSLTAGSRKESLLSSARRSKRNIRRLIDCNVWRWFDPNDKPYTPIPMTFTFRDNIQDIKTGNLEFTKFIRRFNYELGVVELGKNIEDSKKSILQYIAVPEFQPVSQRVHYHVLFFNLPFMKNIYDRMNKIWGKGIFNINGSVKGSFTSRSKRSDMSRVVDYYSKYITKACYDERLFRKKKLFRSLGLLEPLKIVSEEIVREIMSGLPEDSLEWKKEGIPVPYLYLLDYYRYNLAKHPRLEAEIDKYLDPFNKLYELRSVLPKIKRRR